MRRNHPSWWTTSLLFLVCLGGSAAPAQTNATSLLAQLSQAVSGGKPIQSVTLLGNADWHAGSLHDSGSVTLTASSSGAAQVQLALSTIGSRTEGQTGLGSAQSCTWSGKDGLTHDINLQNCWKPFIAFYPAISLQLNLLPGSLGLSDLGIGTVGPGSYRHLQGQFVFSDLPPDQITGVMASSSTDIGLDPTTLLPSVLIYSVQADRGPQTPLQVEMRYANYSAINGVQIPFSIQRFVNGSLQLDITISNAQTN